MAMAAKAYSPLLLRSMAAQKPSTTPTKTIDLKKIFEHLTCGWEPISSHACYHLKCSTTVSTSSSSVKLLTRVEQFCLLSMAEKARLLTAAEKFGISLSTIERLGLLSKAEELGVLSAIIDPTTPSTLLSLSFLLLALGPAAVNLVPEEYPWEVVVQVLVAVVIVVSGSATFAASNLVSTLQKSS